MYAQAVLWNLRIRGEYWGSDVQEWSKAFQKSNSITQDLQNSIQNALGPTKVQQEFCKKWMVYWHAVFDLSLMYIVICYAVVTVSPLDVLWGTGIDLWGETWPITAPHPANLVSRDPTGLGSPEMIWRFLNERPQNSRFFIVSEHGHIELHSKFPRMLPIILHVVVLF